MEDEAISSLGELLGESNVHGYIITGGTEANIMAMRAARNTFKLKNPNCDNIEIIVPKSAHFSFKKASDMLCLKLMEADLDDNYKVDTNSIEDLISENTAAVVAIAGTTELGKIDPVEKISKYLH